MFRTAFLDRFEGGSRGFVITYLRVSFFLHLSFNAEIAFDVFILIE